MRRAVTLFRGDSLSPAMQGADAPHRGRTFAEHFCGNGLMARFGDEGRSVYVRDRDLVDLVLAHVGYNPGHAETPLAYHSPLISFSCSRERAFEYSNRSRQDLEQCAFEEATLFMWRFEPPLDPTPEAGHYVFRYRSDPRNCNEIVAAKLRRGLEEINRTGDLHAFGQALGEQIVLQHAAADTTLHLAEVIDVQAFLRGADLHAREARLAENALAWSKHDDEWLVLPSDPMPDGRGISARLTMNEYLFADAWYRERRCAHGHPLAGS